MEMEELKGDELQFIRQAFENNTNIEKTKIIPSKDYLIFQKIRKIKYKDVDLLLIEEISKYTRREGFAQKRWYLGWNFIE